MGESFHSSYVLNILLWCFNLTGETEISQWKASRLKCMNVCVEFQHSGLSGSQQVGTKLGENTMQNAKDKLSKVHSKIHRHCKEQFYFFVFPHKCVGAREVGNCDNTNY